MQIRRPANPYRALTFLLINVLIAFVLPTIIPLSGQPWDAALFFVVGIIALTLYNRRYAPWLAWSVIFVGYLLWEILISNLQLAWLVIQPKPRLDPGIIAFPLTVSTGLEIIMLASAITLTPGTISVDLSRDEAGRPVLYVHSLTVGDPDEFRRSIALGFERLILRMSRGL